MARVAGAGRPRAVILAGILAVLATALPTLLSTGPAAAHTTLLDSQPAQGAKLAKPPRAVSLTFSEPLQERGAGFAVRGPQDTTPVTAHVDGAVARFPWPPGFASGTYDVSYRVVSQDGHVVDGKLRFTIAAPEGPGRPGRTASSQAAAPSEPAAPAGVAAVPWWIWASLAIGTVVAGVAIRRARPEHRTGR